jgi:hypothetical protein
VVEVFVLRRRKGAWRRRWTTAGHVHSLWRRRWTTPLLLLLLSLRAYLRRSVSPQSGVLLFLLALLELEECLVVVQTWGSTLSRSTTWVGDARRHLWWWTAVAVFRMLGHAAVVVHDTLLEQTRRLLRHARLRGVRRLLRWTTVVSLMLLVEPALEFRLRDAAVGRSGAVRWRPRLGGVTFPQQVEELLAFVACGLRTTLLLCEKVLNVDIW